MSFIEKEFKPRSSSECLLSECAKEINAATVQKELMSCKKKYEESYRDDIYEMIVIAEQADLPE